MAFLIISVSACNNDAGNPSGIRQTDSGRVSTTKMAEQTTSNTILTGPCGKLIFFQQGAEIEATSYNDEGTAMSVQVTKILSVTNNGGFTIASVEGTDTGLDGEKKSTSVKYDYKCDGNKIYFDIASMFRSAEKEQDATFESSLIEYPINLEMGGDLPDAVGMMSSIKDGKKSTMKYVYKNRKVEGREEVTTPAGRWTCYKVTSSIEVEMDIPGMDDKTKEMMKKMREGMKTSGITWFAPDFGIVKMEMYVNGKLQSKNEVTAVKR